MKLLRYGPVGQEKPGILDAQGRIRNISVLVPEIDGRTISPEGLSKLTGADQSILPVVEGTPRIGPCLANVGKFICIGLNYLDHAKETGSAIPVEPIVFMKATSSIIGPNDNIVRPRNSAKLDWEVELGIAIGSAAKYVSEADALSHVAGYFLANDVSERAFQTEGTGQWTKGKSCDSFGPIGPWLVTADEFTHPQNRRLWLDVDGVRHQDGNTANMIFGIAKIISYLSQLMTLHPGDVIITGTPAGVAQGMKPPQYLQPGQTVTLGIDGLGEQKQIVLEDR